jgi:hypothetical protein
MDGVQSTEFGMRRRLRIDDEGAGFLQNRNGLSA